MPRVAGHTSAVTPTVVAALRAILQAIPRQSHAHCAGCCRDISHTPFFVDDKRLGKTSIQEILEELLQPDLRFRSAKLISAG